MSPLAVCPYCNRITGNWEAHFKACRLYLALNENKQIQPKPEDKGWVSKAIDRLRLS